MWQEICRSSFDQNKCRQRKYETLTVTLMLPIPPHDLISWVVKVSLLDGLSSSSRSELGTRKRRHFSPSPQPPPLLYPTPPPALNSDKERDTERGSFFLSGGVLFFHALLAWPQENGRAEKNKVTLRMYVRSCGTHMNALPDFSSLFSFLSRVLLTREQLSCRQ